MKIRRFVPLSLVLGLALVVSCSQGYSATVDNRFSDSAEGVITDNNTGLEWVVGPDRPTSYNEAVAWVQGCEISGGKWRMPTRAELHGLYVKGLGKFNLDPIFEERLFAHLSELESFGVRQGTPLLSVWGEPNDSSTAWAFNSFFGAEHLANRLCSDGTGARVIAVRPLSRK